MPEMNITIINGLQAITLLHWEKTDSFAERNGKFWALNLLASYTKYNNNNIYTCNAILCIIFYNGVYFTN